MQVRAVYEEEKEKKEEEKENEDDEDDEEEEEEDFPPPPSAAAAPAAPAVPTLAPPPLALPSRRERSRTFRAVERHLPAEDAERIEQERVEAAVRLVLDRFEASGIFLPMEHVKGCTYCLAGRRVVHLKVLSGRLCVRSGGGFTDFLEWLSRAQLRR